MCKKGQVILGPAFFGIKGSEGVCLLSLWAEREKLVEYNLPLPSHLYEVCLLQFVLQMANKSEKETDQL